MAVSEVPVRRGYRVVGRVQGVGFRWWTRETANGLGLEGTVRNRPDGSVEIQVHGPASAVNALEQRLAEGPPHARVDAVEGLSSEGAVGPGFEVLF